MTHELIIECNNYYGSPSAERCAAIEKFLMQRIDQRCGVRNVKMAEIEVAPNLVNPQIVIRYTNPQHGHLIDSVDKLLLEIGLRAVKAVITKIVSHAVGGAVVGGAAGAVLGSSSKKGKNAMAAMVIGALLGGLAGSLAEKGIIELVASKETGIWRKMMVQAQ
ncbi:MAG: glycine zipper 2TM domain-containing protein [Nitrososphaera sp.]